jgi:protein SCO1/2
MLLQAGGCAMLAGCDGGTPWHDVDVTGISPPLAISMRQAPDGRRFTEADARGHVTMLYFGYTFCPDVCPLTLENVKTTFSRIGAEAADIRFLFVTVDPGRDSLDVLGRYVGLFGPNFIGLRGTPDELDRLAQRYRIAYSVSLPGNGHDYEVTHSSAIYVFDRTGAARLIVPSMASQTPDIAGLAADLRRLEHSRPSLLERIETLV